MPTRRGVSGAWSWKVRVLFEDRELTAAEVQQLKSAVMPSLFQLREDQKEEARTLARMIGLENVAAQI